MEYIKHLIDSVTPNQLLTYGFLFAILAFMFFIYRMSQDNNQKFHWIDLISDKEGAASLTRILQLAAGITGTWVIIQSTIGKWLTVELFLVYLGAMGISEGYTKFLNAKYTGKAEKDDSK